MASMAEVETDFLVGWSWDAAYGRQVETSKAQRYVTTRCGACGEPVAVRADQPVTPPVYCRPCVAIRFGDA